MKSALLRMAAVAMVVGCVTCDCDEGEKLLSVLTYNTGLAPTVPSYDTRKANVIDALGNITFDFVCLQEVWFEIDMKTIVEKMEKTMQYHFSAIHEHVYKLRDSSTSDHPPCTPQEVETVASCVHLHCSTLNPVQVKSCIVDKCRDQVYGVNQTCRTCITVAGTDDEVKAKCLNGENRFNTPGLLVFSKQPMTDVQFVSYHKDREVLIKRGYIQAQVDETLTFVCTHLTSVFPVFFDVGMEDLYKNYGEMQRAEIDELGKTFSSSSHVLMGDLNTGPARNEPGQSPINGTAEENYNHLINDLHYVNPYTRDKGLCTYCNSDNSAAWEKHKGDAIVDHVLLSECLEPVSTKSKRILMQDKGQLSDHYGVGLDMCLL